MAAFFFREEGERKKGRREGRGTEKPYGAAEWQGLGKGNRKKKKTLSKTGLAFWRGRKTRKPKA